MSVIPVRRRGAGASQWNIHGAGFTDDRYDVVSVFAEPRQALSDAPGSVIPFVAGRLAWARKSIRVGSVSRAATGIALDGLAGWAQTQTT